MDLPAPFSPMIACTVPGSMSKLMSEQATTPLEYSLLSRENDSRGAVARREAPAETDSTDASRVERCDVMFRMRLQSTRCQP